VPTSGLRWDAGARTSRAKPPTSCQIAVVYVPAANGIFHTRPLTFAELGVCTAAAVVVFVAVEVEKWLVRGARDSSRGIGDERDV
jgi:Cation transporting ATPase, C-terminus